jgi:hypothetical protein
MTPSKMGILTYHYIPNNGAFLFAFSLSRLLQKEFGGFEVQVIDYKSPRLAGYEILKRFKVFQGIPNFYMKRARMWDEQVRMHLTLDSDIPRFVSEKKLQEHLARRYDILVTGMDVWCMTHGSERPNFPNIYWLPERTATPKVAYGVSAYNSDAGLIQRSSAQIGNYLDGFEVVGARDRFTLDLALSHRKRTDSLVELIPDPTFTYEFQNTNVVEKLKFLGIDLKRPTVGLLFFGDDALAKQILAHYKSKGYQILAMSMYNAVADFNLGHVLTPFEWAEAFRYLDFCITDRFHGTIFCLLNQTPFISLEKERFLPRSQSKLFDLLAGFHMDACYQNPADNDFVADKFLAHADEIQASWEQTFKPNIQPQIEVLKQEHTAFLSRMRETL